ncbi:MAG: SRPBCC domain-containing protein, partial [Pseudomonadota bacterium]
PEGDGTRLAYDVDASVGGKLAQLGSRLIDSFAKKMADQFFERFQAVVEGTDGGPEVEVSEEKKGWLARLRGA